MLYTVGPARRYRAFLDVWGRLYKTGRKEGYPGGCVFQTIEDAHRFIEKRNEINNFGVFGLKEVVWDVDTEPSVDGWWHHLLHNRPIVLLDDVKVDHQ